MPMTASSRKPLGVGLESSGSEVGTDGIDVGGNVGTGVAVSETAVSGILVITAPDVVAVASVGDAVLGGVFVAETDVALGGITVFEGVTLGGSKVFVAVDVAVKVLVGDGVGVWVVVAVAVRVGLKVAVSVNVGVRVGT